MNNYKFYLRMPTLSYIEYFDADPNNIQTSFEIGGLIFKHWDFNYIDGHKGNAWKVTTNIEATSFIEAEKVFAKKLCTIVSKISFVAQCSIEYNFQSILIHKKDSNIAWFRYVKPCGGVGLSFSDNELMGLKFLVDKGNIPQEFFYYWHDMINATNYSSKLLLIFSALESLTFNENKEAIGDKRKKILGEDLSKKVFKNDQDNIKNAGIRHRFSHGQNFSEKDDEDYLGQIYAKIVEYFNKEIFGKNLIESGTKEPPRHIYGNCNSFNKFIQWDENRLNFKQLVENCDKDNNAFPEPIPEIIYLNSDKEQESY